MHGTVPQKIGRVLTNLVMHPSYNRRYIAHNVMKGRSPLELEIPWFSYAAIDFLDEFVRAEMTVFEYGSGGSTVFFARRAKSVFSVEDNREWYDLVTAKLRENSINNATLNLCPYDFRHPENFEKSDYYNAMPDERFDILVIDGKEEWTQVRPTCFRRAEDHVKPGGIIVLDDSWRYSSVRENHRAKKHQVFQSVGPARPGVTSTDIFFY